MIRTDEWNFFYGTNCYGEIKGDNTDENRQIKTTLFDRYLMPPFTTLSLRAGSVMTIQERKLFPEGYKGDIDCLFKQPPGICNSKCCFTF